MEKITFTCEIVTPVFSAGADGKTAELRTSSIKGLMRFWWRAINCQYTLDSEVWKSKPAPNEKQEKRMVNPGLRAVETAIFGGVGEDDTEGQRSSFVMRVAPHPANKKPREHRMVPHKESGFMNQAFEVGSTYDVIFQIPNDYTASIDLHDKHSGNFKEKRHYFDTQKLIALFQLTCILGGIGKRVRRGMGSVAVTNILIGGDTQPIAPSTLSSIEALLKVLVPHFRYDAISNSIVNVYQGRMEKYPWISKIEIGQPDRNITRTISDTTHKLKERDPRKYEPSMGHASRGRFASPIYASVLADNAPVVTTLNTIPDRDLHLLDLGIQRDFKNKVLR